MEPHVVMRDLKPYYRPTADMRPSYTESESHCPGRLKPWLIWQIDSQQIAGLEWVERPRGIFKLSWTHKSKENWTEDDAAAKLSKLWAINKGKYREGVDDKNYPKWKQTLRAALRSTGIIEVPNHGQGACSVSYKSYSIPTDCKADPAVIEVKREPQDIPGSNRESQASSASTDADGLFSTLIPATVEEARSCDSLPSDLRNLASTDLVRKADTSISIEAAFDSDHFRRGDPMDTT